MDWKAVEDRIVKDDENKWDHGVTGHQLRISWSGALELTNGSKRCYLLSDLATTQMCQKLGIPVDYYRRLPDEMKAIIANYDLGRMNETSYLLRGKGEWTRAFLSAEYVAYNNMQIIETVQALLEQTEVSVKSFVLEETHLYLKIVSEDLLVQESGLKAGIMIGNSEVGQGSVSVEPFVYRKACTNDLVISQEKSFRHPHIHFTVSELNRRMAEGISKAFEVASSILDAFLRTREEPILDPVETIRRLATQRKFSQKFTDEVVSSYQGEPDPTRFGVINSFTNAAQKLGPLQRIEMERFAGTLLEGQF